MEFYWPIRAEQFKPFSLEMRTHSYRKQYPNFTSIKRLKWKNSVPPQIVCQEKIFGSRLDVIPNSQTFESAALQRRDLMKRRNVVVVGKVSCATIKSLSSLRSWWASIVFLLERREKQTSSSTIDWKMQHRVSSPKYYYSVDNPVGKKTFFTFLLGTLRFPC